MQLVVRHEQDLTDAERAELSALLRACFSLYANDRQRADRAWSTAPPVYRVLATRTSGGPQHFIRAGAGAASWNPHWLYRAAITGDIPRDHYVEPGEF